MHAPRSSLWLAALVALGSFGLACGGVVSSDDLDAVAALATQDPLAPDPAAYDAASPKGTWQFNESEITGGGLATEIALDPNHPGYATVGGDSWGLYNTRNGGNQWLPAMKASAGNPMTGLNGTFYYSGLAYSANPATPWVVYGLLGRTGQSGGGFIVMNGDSVQRLRMGEPSGGEPSWNRHVHPRPGGRRVVTSWDGKTERIFVGAGGGTGLWRSTDAGATWTNLALGAERPIITGMAFLSNAHDTLVITTTTSKVYVVSNVNGSASVRTVDLPGGLQFEEVSRLDATLFAAARGHGVYASADGLTWHAAGSIPSTVDVVAVAGHGTTLFAGCVADHNTPNCIYRSTDSGTHWTPVANHPSFSQWGSNVTWWHSNQPGAMINGPQYVTSQIALTPDGQTVYVAGRAGVWKSADGGETWRPATEGLGGTMHTKVVFDGTHVVTDDVDFVCEETRPSTHFSVVADILNPSSFPALKSAHGGHFTAATPMGTVQVVLPDNKGNPAKFLVDGRDMANEWFRAEVVKASDVLYRDGYVYIVQFGGGVVLAHVK